MPKVSKKPAPAPASAPAVPETAPPVDNGIQEGQGQPQTMPLVYDKLGIKEYSVDAKDGPLTIGDIVELMGWETEPEYQVRMMQEHPGTTKEVWLYHEEFHCLNLAKQKVRCKLNAGNRPFDMGWEKGKPTGWCGEIVHMILSGQWAGPRVYPGETVNGETVRISKYGRVLSGQHQMTAAKIANEILQAVRKDPGYDNTNPKYPSWNGCASVVLETIVITGLSEHPKVLETIDYVKPRTMADVLFTMPLFRERTPAERKEMTRMLSSAIDLLWLRTDTKGYKTHPEVVGFLERHKRLLQCVEYIFIENSSRIRMYCTSCKAVTFDGNDIAKKVCPKCKSDQTERKDDSRRLSKLHLGAGQCAALLYLMGCGTQTTTDYSDQYRNEAPPNEKGLDWGFWDKAKLFWTKLASGENGLIQVRKAINNLVTPDETPEDTQALSLGGRLSEKLAILAYAWEVFKDHPDSAGVCFTEEDLSDEGCLHLSYSNLDDKGDELPEGKIKLLDVADFYGIDCPEVIESQVQRRAEPEPAPPTPEEIEKGREEADRLRAQEDAAKKKK